MTLKLFSVLRHVVTGWWGNHIRLNQFLCMCWILIMLSLVFDPNMRARVCGCVWQDGLSSRSALWDLCYTGAPPLQPCCHDPAERGGLCSYICCNAVTINGLLMPTSACCSSDFKHLLQQSYCALNTLTSWRLHILKVYVFYLPSQKNIKQKQKKSDKTESIQKDPTFRISSQWHFLQHSCISLHCMFTFVLLFIILKVCSYLHCRPFSLHWYFTWSN